MPNKTGPAPLSGNWRHPSAYHEGGLEKIDPLDANIDIVVDLADGRSYSLTLFTVQNLRTLMRRGREQHEPPYGLYFSAAPDMVVLERLTREDIDAAVAELLRSEEILYVGELIPKEGGPKVGINSPQS
jgi:hypothetical protein